MRIRETGVGQTQVLGLLVHYFDEVVHKIGGAFVAS